jgi:hypothetical protein
MFGWLRGKRFAAPIPPLRDYWAMIQVALHEPVLLEGEKPAVGYLHILGLRCTPLRLQSLIQETESDGLVVWSKPTEWREVSLNRLSRKLRSQIDPSSDECVWHRSGRIYFPEEAPG